MGELLLVELAAGDHIRSGSREAGQDPSNILQHPVEPDGGVRHGGHGSKFHQERVVGN